MQFWTCFVIEPQSEIKIWVNRHYQNSFFKNNEHQKYSNQFSKKMVIPSTYICTYIVLVGNVVGDILKLLLQILDKFGNLTPTYTKSFQNSKKCNSMEESDIRCWWLRFWLLSTPPLILSTQRVLRYISCFIALNFHFSVHCDNVIIGLVPQV